MDDRDAVNELDKIFAAGDAWLRRYGMVTSIQHNSIVANLYMNFPKVKYLEYFLPKDQRRRKVTVKLYVPFWKLLFTRREQMISDVVELLREYLYDYDITVELKRYRAGVERSNEVPADILNSIASPVADELSSLQEPVASGPATEPSTGASDADPATSGDDQTRSVSTAAGSGDVPPIPDSSGT